VRLNYHYHNGLRVRIGSKLQEIETNSQQTTGKYHLSNVSCQQFG
jgi:ribosomal protein L32